MWGEFSGGIIDQVETLATIHRTSSSEFPSSKVKTKTKDADVFADQFGGEELAMGAHQPLGVAFATSQGEVLANCGFMLFLSTSPNPKELLLFCSKIPKFVLSMVAMGCLGPGGAAGGALAGHCVWGAYCMPL